MTVIDFLSEAEIFNLNLAKLVLYMEKSKVAIKLRGFSQRKLSNKENQERVIRFLGFFLPKFSTKVKSLIFSRRIKGRQKGFLLSWLRLKILNLTN
jgi:hypothetical protein